MAVIAPVQVQEENRNETTIINRDPLVWGHTTDIPNKLFNLICFRGDKDKRWMNIALFGLGTLVVGVWFEEMLWEFVMASEHMEQTDLV